MKKIIAGWLATIVHRLDPNLAAFNQAVVAARNRAEDTLRRQWRKIDWGKALRFEYIEGGNPDCDHSEVTPIKKYRTQDWTQKCNKCNATLMLHNTSRHRDKPGRKSQHYLTAQVLYLSDCFKCEPIVTPVPFDDIEDSKQREYFATAERYL